MDKVEFVAFAFASPGYIATQTVDHVAVAAAGHNWNCFGRGVDAKDGRQIASGMGNAEWAALIYGKQNEACGGDQPAAGVIEKYEGVCHTAANRILVLLGDDIDSRKALCNELATLMYGKFGFHTDTYIETVKATAAQINAQTPGAIPQAEIDAVVTRITRGMAPDQELLLLKADVEEQFQVHFDAFTDQQKSDFVAAYTEFQTNRKADFDAEPRDGNGEFRARLANRMKPHLLKCLNSFVQILGPEQYTKVFHLMPPEAAKFLLGV